MRDWYSNQYTNIIVPASVDIKNAQSISEAIKHLSAAMKEVNKTRYAARKHNGMLQIVSRLDDDTLKRIDNLHNNIRRNINSVTKMLQEQLSRLQTSAPTRQQGAAATGSPTSYISVALTPDQENRLFAGKDRASATHANRMVDVVHSWHAAIIRDRMKRAAANHRAHKREPSAKWLEGVATEVWKHHSKSYKYMYDALVAVSAKTFQNVKSKSALDRLGMEWEKVSKQAAQQNNLVKKADDPPPAVGGKISKQPGSAYSGRAVSREADEPEKSAVQRMQLVLNNLGQQLSGISGTNLKKMFPKAKDNIRAYANKLIKTGPPGAVDIDRYDGKWGTNTQAAIKAARNLMAFSGKKTAELVDGPTYTRARKSRKAIKADAAKANRNAISVAQFMGVLGLSVPGGLSTKQKYEHYDKFGPDAVISKDKSWILGEESKAPNAVSITSKDLAGLMRFDAFLDTPGLNLLPGKRPAPEKKPEKPSGPEPTDTKVKEAQAQLRPVPPNVTDPNKRREWFIYLNWDALRGQASPAQTKQGRTVAEWRQIIRLFYQRANSQFNVAEGTDKARKDAYRRAIAELYFRFKKAIAAHGLKDSDVISAYDLQYGGVSGQAGQAGQVGGAYTGGPGEGVEAQFPGKKPSIGQPIAQEINFNLLRRAYPSALKNWSKYGSELRFTSLNLNHMFDSPTSAATSMLKRPTWKEALAYLRQNPNAGSRYPDSHGRPTTWAQLPQVRTAEAAAAVASIMREAHLNKLRYVIAALHDDLGNVMFQYDGMIAGGRVSKNMIQATRDYWRRWSEALMGSGSLYERAGAEVRALRSGKASGAFPR
jgi:hypothetical protein